MDLPGFRLSRVHCCSSMMLGCAGLSSWMMLLTALLSVSACFALCVLASDGTLMIILVAVMFAEVKPLSIWEMV